MTQVAATNRVRLQAIRESTFGITPGSPRMRTVRMTGESLQYTPTFVSSSEIRADRMSPDPILINQQNQGGINVEIAYPVDNSALSELYRSALFNPWTTTPFRDNDGTAASQVTAITVTTNVVTVASGTAFVVGHLVRHTGFAIAGNNGIFRVTTGGTTTYTCSAGAFATEASPPAAVRVKVVGFAGVSGDITATASGLGSTALDFTTLGLSVGQWIKIGGTAASDKFATAVCNDWVRITAIAATALTCDNLPSGWATDAGTGKTIKVWFGDQIKNGTTQTSLTLERGFLDQGTPTYIQQRGMVVDSFSHTITTDQIITGSFNMKGLTGTQGTASIASTIDAAPTSAILSSNANVGRIAEAGVTIAAPNWIRSLQFTANNNLRLLNAVGNVGSVDIGIGEIAIDGTIEAYFGSNALLSKMFAGTVTNVSTRVTANSQALTYQFPRITLTGGSPNAGAKNQDVVVQFKFMTSVDTLTNAELVLDRHEYFEV
jgi:hypothetical protein